MPPIFEILWMVVFLTNGIPGAAQVDEKIKFQDLDQCEKFGAEMSPRIADWFRGARGEDWDYPVRVRFKCQLSGEAA